MWLSSAQNLTSIKRTDKSRILIQIIQCNFLKWCSFSLCQNFDTLSLIVIYFTLISVSMHEITENIHLYFSISVVFLKQIIFTKKGGKWILLFLVQTLCLLCFIFNRVVIVFLIEQSILISKIASFFFFKINTSLFLGKVLFCDVKLNSHAFFF